MASSKPSSSLNELTTVVSTTVGLLLQLEGILSSIATGEETTPDAPSSTEPPLDALALARDSATLVRAHSTKVSLFIINDPFTPSAIIKVLRELVASPVPSLASAVQNCHSARYSLALRRRLAMQSYVVLKELRELLQKIPKDGKPLPAGQKPGPSTASSKNSIVTTGTLWSACDEVVRLSKLGVAGFIVERTEEFRDTLKDVMEELKEWGEDDGGDDGFDDAPGFELETESPHASTQAMLDSLMNSHQTIPADDPDHIRERLDSCLKRIRLTTLLYQAIVKRRLKKLPALPTTESSVIPERLDEVVAVLQRIPDRFGDLAQAFYDLRPGEIDRLMDQCFFDAFAASELMVKGWDGGRDEFSDWAEKFQIEIKKG